MARQRKAWRLRTGDSTIVEVSAAPDATRTQIRRRGRWILVVGMLMAILAVGAFTASSADLVTAEVTGTGNDVTVTQGTSVNQTINVSADGSISCSITSSNPATATVDTSYSFDSSGNLTSGTPSSSMGFYSNGLATGGSPGNCGVTWGSSPTPYNVTATFSAASSTPVGNYIVTLSASAGTTAETNPSVSGGKLGDTTATTITVHVVAPVVTNHSPSISWSADPSSANEGQTKTYSFSISDSDSGDSWSFASGYPDCGSGGSLVSQSIDNSAKTGTFNCSFADGPASSTVKAEVKDAASAPSNELTQAVTVNNVAPSVTLSASNDTTVNEGSTQHTYSYTISDPGQDTVSSVTTSCGTGGTKVALSDTNTDTTGSFKCTFPDGPASSTVSALATDSDGAAGAADTQAITVNNVAPTVTLASSNDTTVSEGSTQHTYSYTISDPGQDTVSSVTTSCGTGGAKVANSDTNTDTAGSFKCTFPDGPASPTVSALATDSDGAAGAADTQAVTVNNVAPTGTLANTGPVNEGSSATVSFSNPSDPSAADTTAGFHYAFSCSNDASSLPTTYAGAGTANSTSCSFADNGSYTVAGRIFDKDDGYTDYTTVVTVTNVAPTVGALTLGGATGTACLASSGYTVTLDFSFSDPGVNDNPWAVDINWGDGSTHTTYNAATQGTQTQQSHIYGVGSFTISVSVTDKDGGKGTSSTGANAVSHLYNMSGILAPFNSDGTSVWKYGSTIPVKVTITDCNGNPVSGLAPKVGTSLVSSTDPSLLIDESLSTSAADTTGVMRFDSTASQYIYNFGSKNLSDPSATYYMTVKGTDSNGTIVTSPPMVQQKFGLKSK